MLLEISRDKISVKVHIKRPRLASADQRKGSQGLV